MSDTHKKKMSSESDEDLEGLIENKKKHVPEAIEAAIAELQKRGRVFTAEELHTIRHELKKFEDQKSIREQAPAQSMKPAISKAKLLIIIAMIVIIIAVLLLFLK